jgi:dipeptidase D
MDIHKGLGNANKIMNRILLLASNEFNIKISEIDGGSLRNAIPRESNSIIAIDRNRENDFLNFIKIQKAIIKAEYVYNDANLSIEALTIDTPKTVFESNFQNKLLRSIYTCANGIYRMSPTINGLVQTSNNLARVLVKNGNYSIQCLTRSSVDSEKMDLALNIQSCFELMGADVKFSGSYPGWTPRTDAKIVKLMSNLYEKMFNEKPHVNACHAGLECGILGTNYPQIEMISFGPNIRGAHSPDECCQISSVQKYWSFLLETLKEIPVK